jgi:hypothetical protein
MKMGEREGQVVMEQGEKLPLKNMMRRRNMGEAAERYEEEATTMIG